MQEQLPDKKAEENNNVTDASALTIPTAPAVEQNNFEEKITTVNFSDPSASKPLVDTDMVAPSLVAFNPGTVPVKEEPKVEVKVEVEGEEVYVCIVCGYVHKGPMPVDFKCPVCGVDRTMFKKIKS